MNTGVQRSSATPTGAWTTTTPKGALKAEPKKDLEKIMLADLQNQVDERWTSLLELDETARNKD